MEDRRDPISEDPARKRRKRQREDAAPGFWDTFVQRRAPAKAQPTPAKAAAKPHVKAAAESVSRGVLFSTPSSSGLASSPAGVEGGAGESPEEDGFESPVLGQPAKRVVRGKEGTASAKAKGVAKSAPKRVQENRDHAEDGAEGEKKDGEEKPAEEEPTKRPRRREKDAKKK